MTSSESVCANLSHWSAPGDRCRAYRARRALLPLLDPEAQAVNPLLLLTGGVSVGCLIAGLIAWYGGPTE